MAELASAKPARYAVHLASWPLPASQSAT